VPTTELGSPLFETIPLSTRYLELQLNQDATVNNSDDAGVNIRHVLRVICQAQR